MNVHTTNIQPIFNDDGKPVFVVIPYNKYRQMVEPRSTIPHEVVGMVINKGCSLPRAWRIYLRLTQKDVAEALAVSQSAISQIEKTGTVPKKQTLEKLANIFNIDTELLIDY